MASLIFGFVVPIKGKAFELPVAEVPPRRVAKNQPTLIKIGQYAVSFPLPLLAASPSMNPPRDWFAGCEIQCIRTFNDELSAEWTKPSLHVFWSDAIFFQTRKHHSLGSKRVQNLRPQA